MKHLVAAFALAFVICGARAAPLAQASIDHMTAQCRGVMGKDVCRVMNDGVSVCKDGAEGRQCRLMVFRLKFPRGIALPSQQGPLVRFTADEYFAYVDAGESMCDLIEQTCGQDGESRGCLLARLLWRQR